MAVFLWQYNRLGAAFASDNQRPIVGGLGQLTPRRKQARHRCCRGNGGKDVDEKWLHGNENDDDDTNVTARYIVLFFTFIKFFFFFWLVEFVRLLKFVSNSFCAT